MTPHANLQCSQFFTQVPYGRPSPIPLAGPEQRREQARTPSPPGLPLALPQGMSCPLPAAHTRSEDATAAAYLSLAATSRWLQSETMHLINWSRLLELSQRLYQLLTASAFVIAHRNCLHTKKMKSTPSDSQE